MVVGECEFCSLRLIVLITVYLRGLLHVFVGMLFICLLWLLFTCV